MGTLLDQPHHDGSEAYVLDPAAELGDETTVVLRVPTATSPSTSAPPCSIPSTLAQPLTTGMASLSSRKYG